MYRASDALMKHRQAIEAHLFTRAMGLFDPEADRHPVRSDQHASSKGRPAVNPRPSGGTRRRSAATVQLLTLGLVMDGAGFVRRSQVFAGRVDEHQHPGRDAGGARGASTGGSSGGDGPGGGDRGSHPVVEGGRVPPPWWPAAKAPGSSTPNWPLTTGDRFQGHLQLHKAGLGGRGGSASLLPFRGAGSQGTGHCPSASAGASSRGSPDSPRDSYGRGLTRASRRSGNGSGG